MNDYMSEKEQIEQIKEWWNRSGKWLAVAVVIGLALGFGYRYWQRHEVQQNEAASQLYQMMAVARYKKQPGVEQQYAKQLQTHYAASPYTTFAVLLLAKDQVVAKQLQEAASNLQWVMQHAPSNALKQLARIRAARVLLGLKQDEQALALLAKIDDNTFLPMVDNVKGDIYRAEGNQKAAASAYAKAKVGYAALNVANPIMLMQSNS